MILVGIETVSFGLLTALLLITPALNAKSPYADGRPAAKHRIACQDEGIVLRHGDGPDSCDTYGIREAVVNREGDRYYLFYDGAGKDGWIACLAESQDLRHWTKRGLILELGKPGRNDAKSASSPWVIKEKDTWHMFYVGTPNTTPPPYRIPAFPYLTMKAQSQSLAGPWKKQYDVVALPPRKIATTPLRPALVLLSDTVMSTCSFSVVPPRRAGRSNERWV